MSQPLTSFEMDALAAKVTPVSLDTFLLKDSADSNLLKEITFPNLQVAILNDGSLVTLLGVQTLQNKTLTLPIILDFTNATHDHADLEGGGTILAAAISDFNAAVSANSDVTANTAKVTNATHTGDATGATVLTIVDNVVTFAKMQNINTTSFIGRVTAAIGDPENLTGTQATTLLDIFTDILKGLVPASGGGTDNFLRADGVFAQPPGAGASAPFTWGASDEDSPVITGLLYTTEASATEITLSEVVLSLKNAPTGSTITVDILKEDGVNLNTFTSIFTILPTIDINEFTSQTATIAATFVTTTWEIQRRLQLVLTMNDSNAAATGIKVTLA